MHNQTDPSLLPLFTEAFLAEQKLYEIRNYGRRYLVCLVIDVLKGNQVYSAHPAADCERFVLERCVRTLIKTLADRAGYDDEDVKNWLLMVLNGEIKPLATEPETTRGDENAA